MSDTIRRTDPLLEVVDELAEACRLARESMENLARDLIAVANESVDLTESVRCLRRIVEKGG